MQFSILPWKIIIQYLSPTELLNLGEVNRELRKLTFDSNKVTIQFNSYELFNLFQNKKYVYEIVQNYNYRISYMKLFSTINWCDVLFYQKYYTVIQAIYNPHENFYLQILSFDKNFFKYIPYQTFSLCYNAIMLNPMNIRFVKNKTPELCLLAVKINGLSLRFINERYKNTELSKQLCIIAVQQNGEALNHVIHKTPELCLLAVKNDPGALLFVGDYQTEEICLEAVKQKGTLLLYVHEQTEKVCMEAVKNDLYSFNFVRKIFESVCSYVVRKKNSLLYRIPDKHYRYYIFMKNYEFFESDFKKKFVI